MSKQEAAKNGVVGVKFKGYSITQLEQIIEHEKRPDGSDISFSDAARLAVAFYVRYKYAFKGEK
jgi:hypothetical protein